MALQEGQKSESEEQEQILLKLALCGRVDGSTWVFLAVQHAIFGYTLNLHVL